MGNNMKKCFLLLMILCLLPISALSFEATSYTFSYDYLGSELRIVQDAYQPMGIYQNLGLKNPEDMTVKNGKMYIADTGNRRVLVIDIATGEALEIKGEFSQPIGIAADAEGRIYVADYQKSAVFRFDAQGNLEMTYDRPDSPAYGESNLFKPRRVAPIGDGGVYLLVDGASNGIVQMNAQGEFVGFFASNAVTIPFKYRLYDLILTDEQMERYGLGTPPKFGNIMMGTDGLVYAVMSTTTTALQKLSYGGTNLFASNGKNTLLEYPVSMTMTEDGSIYVLHSTGYVSELTRDGVLLYRFGGQVLDASREGLTQTAAGLGVDEENNVYVLDKSTGLVHVLAPTSAHELTRTAIGLYYAGDYDQAGELLDEALRYNGASYHTRLYRGKLFMHIGEYEKALEQFELCKEKSEYSDAYWELRNIFLQENGMWILLGVIAAIAVLVLFRIIRPGKGEEYNSYASSKQLPSQWTGLKFKYLWRAVLHPIDTAYEIKHGHMGGYGAALTLLALTIAAFVARTLCSGFLFSEDADTFPAALYILGLLAVAVLFVVSNFFITSINDGEGTLKMITSVFAYALVPLIIGLPIMTIVCNVLTLQEALIVNTLTIFLVGLCAVNLSMMLMELHNYSFKQYLGSIILTVLFMMLCVVVLSMIYLLGKQCVDFVKDLWTEVVIRG